MISIFNTITINHTSNDVSFWWLLLCAIPFVICILIASLEEEKNLVSFGFGFSIGLAILSCLVLLIVNGIYHRENIPSKIEEKYNIEILNFEDVEKNITEIDGFDSVEMSYKSGGKMYIETIYVSKKDVPGIKKDFTIELFSNADSEKVEAIPFEACSEITCEGGVRTFNPDVKIDQ